MRKQKYSIFVFSILLAVVAIVCFAANDGDGGMPLKARVVYGAHTEELTCCKDQWNDYYFFIPGYADLSQVQIYSQTNDEIWIGDHMITRKGLSCDQFQLNETYGMARFGGDSTYDGVIRFVQSGNVPTMYLDVASGNMEYIHEKKGNEEFATMRLYAADGTLENRLNVESIKGRGNATWEWPKKSYSLSLSNETDLLQMGKAQKWILLSNGYDSSNLKNKMAYDLAKNAGMAYSPDSRWVDLYLNGEYAGLYLLCERNEVHPERVDITPDNSFLISREGQGRLMAHDYPYINLEHYKGYRIHHSSYGLDQVQEMWQSVEDALLSENGIDPRTGKHWTALIDLDSWVEKYLIDEVAVNYDGGGISQFFYYDGENPTGKIYAGPVWDMDITFGAEFWQTFSPNVFAARRPIYLYPTENAEFYVLYQQEEFYDRMVEIYQNAFRPAMIELIDSGLDRYYQQIAPAAYANSRRWETGSPEEAKEEIKAFLTERVAFLDSLWIAEEEYCDVRMLVFDWVDSYKVDAWFVVRPGESLPDIAKYESGAWYVWGTDELFDITQPIYESVDLYLKTEQTPYQMPGSTGTEKVPMAYIGLLAILAAVFVMDRRQTKKGTREKTGS